MVTALMVPDEAIQSDQARKTVLVVAPDGTVAASPSNLARSCAACASCGRDWPRDNVVVTNIQAASPGAQCEGPCDPDPPQAQAADTGISAPAAAQATLAR
jgi:hypothetical protein